MGLSRQDTDIWSDLEVMPLVSLISLISSIIKLGYFKASSNALFPQAAVQLVHGTPPRRADGCARALLSQQSHDAAEKPTALRRVVEPDAARHAAPD